MNHWLFWLLIGIVGLIGGVSALLNPFVATVTAEQIAAWFFIISGILQILAVFRTEGWGRRIWALILAAAFLWLGLTLLANPFAGIISLTLMAAIMFFVSGLTKMFGAFTMRGTGYFWMIFLSGAVSVLLAVMVFTNFPQSAAVLLGILLAVELLSSGAALIAFALFLRNNQDVFERPAKT